MSGVPRLLVTLKNDPTAFVAFYKYAEKHLVLDSLNFLLDVNEYNALPPFMRTQKEEQIVMKYIKPTSKQCINITHRIRDAILEKYGSGRVHIFDKAVDATAQLLEEESFNDFKAAYKPDQYQKVSTKAKNLSSVLNETVNGDMVGPCVFFLTGVRGKDAKRQALNQEGSLKKWVTDGDTAKVFWLTLEEDLDPVVLSSIFSLLNSMPGKLQPFLQTVIIAGLEDAKGSGANFMSELYPAEQVLKEYLYSVGKTWWSKILKKSIESIYKEDFDQSNEGTTSVEGPTVAGTQKIFSFVSTIINNILTEPKVPVELKYVLERVHFHTTKTFTNMKKERCLLSTTKILLDAVCTVLVTPDKAPFEVVVKDAIITRGNALLVADSLRCLVESETDGLGRSNEVINLFNQIKTTFTKALQIWITAQISEKDLEIKPSSGKGDVDTHINIIGHYLATNANIILSNFQTNKLGTLGIFLDSNNKETGSFGDTASFGDEDRSTPSARVLTSFPSRKEASQRSKTIPTRQAAISMSKSTGIHQGGQGQFSGNTPIGELMKYIVNEKLQIPVDHTKFTAILKEECIYKVSHLQLLPPAELARINLPVLVRYTLAEYCNVSATPSILLSSVLPAGGPPTGRSFGTDTEAGGEGYDHSGSFQDDAPEKEKSPTFGISATDKDSVCKSWMLLHKRVQEGLKVETSTGPEPVSRVFYTILWDEWIKLDPIANTMFKLRSRKEREIHVNRILSHVLGALDDPTAGREKLKNLGIQHCIWNIQDESFGALSVAFVKALEAALGNDLDEDTKNAWATLLTEAGSVIVSRYDGIMKGSRGELFTKQGGNWKKYYTKLTHDTLFLFKNRLDDNKKAKLKFLFQHATDVDTIDEEGKIDSVTPYTFSIAFGAVTKYFCAMNSEKMKEWVDNLTARIKAFIRLRAAEADGPTKLTSAEMKRLKIRDKAQSESKAEKAAHRVLRYRKHIDAQIKTSNDFGLFDNLLQCTIVIDTKGTVQYANEAGAQLMGYKTKEIIGKNVKLLMPERYAIEHDQYLENYLTTGRKKVIGMGRDLPIKMKDGTEKLCNLTVVDHQQTGTRYFIGTLIPPADGSSTSESGEVTRNFSIFDKMLQGTISITKEGIIDYVNEAICKMTGYSKKELVGKNVKVLMTAKRAALHDSYLQNYLKTGIKKVIGVGRSVDVKAKDETVMRCLLTVTEHFQGGVPFFMGTLDQTTGDISSSHDASFEQDPFALFDNLLDATVVIGFDGIIAYTNNAVSILSGYKPSELLGKNVSCLMTPQVARKHDGYLRTYARTGVKRIIGKGREVQLLTKFGQIQTIHLSVTEHELGGGATSFIGTLTPHKEEFSLYDQLLDCTIVINEQGVIQYANNALKKISGYRPSAVIGKNVKILMPPEYAAKHDKYLKNYLTTGKKKIIGTGRAVPLLSRSGTVVSSHLSLVESKTGGRRVFVGTLRTKQDEEDLQELNLLEVTKTVLQDVANPCIVITKRGNIKVFNQAAETITGHKADEVTGKNIKCMMPEEYAIGHDNYLKNYLKTGESKIVGKGRVVPFVLADKTVVPFHLSVSVKKKEGKVIYFIGILCRLASLETLSPGVADSGSENS